MSVILTTDGGTVVETFRQEPRAGLMYKISNATGVIYLENAEAIDVCEAITDEEAG